MLLAVQYLPNKYLIVINFIITIVLFVKMGSTCKERAVNHVFPNAANALILIIVKAAILILCNKVDHVSQCLCHAQQHNSVSTVDAGLALNSSKSAQGALIKTLVHPVYWDIVHRLTIHNVFFVQWITAEHATFHHSVSNVLMTTTYFQVSAYTVQLQTASNVLT